MNELLHYNDIYQDTSGKPCQLVSGIKMLNISKERNKNDKLNIKTKGN